MYNDPTGHVGTDGYYEPGYVPPQDDPENPECTDSVECDLKGEDGDEDDSGDNDTNYEKLEDYAEHLLMLMKSGQIAMTDLEAMTNIVSMAATMYGDDSVAFLDALTRVFNGVSYSKYTTLSDAAFFSNCGGVGRDPSDGCGNEYAFGDTGFNTRYKDGHNQVFHVMPYIAHGATNGLSAAIGLSGNLLHEKLIGDPEQMSKQDEILAIAGIKMGIEWRESGSNPADLAVLIYKNLK